MNQHGTLEFQSAGEPAHLEGVGDRENHKNGTSGTGPGRASRSFRASWQRRLARRPLAGECARNVHRLSPGEERMLAQRGRAGDVDAEQQLITANLGLVLHAVRDYRQCGVPLDDLIQEGNLGLIRAARHFDPSMHTARFATYATYWIRCFIVRALASNGSLIQRPEHAHLLRVQYREAVDELRMGGAATSGEPGEQSPTLEDVAQYLGVPVHRLLEAKLAADDGTICQSLAESTLADGPAPEESLLSNEDRTLLCAALRRLSPFEAWVICERFGLDEPPGRFRRPMSSARDPEEQSARRANLSKATVAASADCAQSHETYFQRSYSDMVRDCGLSVFRLRQVEKTALDKLRAFLGRRMTDLA